MAESIVNAVEPKLKTKNFPDDFANGAKLDLPLVFDRGSLKEITIGHLLDIEVHAKGGIMVYSATHPAPVSQAKSTAHPEVLPSIHSNSSTTVMAAKTA